MCSMLGCQLTMSVNVDMCGRESNLRVIAIHFMGCGFACGLILLFSME